MAEKTIDKALLKGLKFRGTKQEKYKDKDDPKIERTKYTPFERPLAPEDVTGCVDYGDKVVITAADGRKHTIEKPEGKPEPRSAALNPDQAINAIAKMDDADAIKSFIEGEKRPGVLKAAESAIAGLK